MKRTGVPEFLIAITPLMEELLYLRKEVDRLRWEKAPPTKGLTEYLEGTGLELRRDDDGRWSYRIAGIYGDLSTGGGPYDTDQLAFKAAVTRAIGAAADIQRELDEMIREQGE